MELKEIVKKQKWEELNFSDDKTEEERKAAALVMKKAVRFKAILNREQLPYFVDYVSAVADYLNVSKKAAYENGLRQASPKKDVDG